MGTVDVMRMPELTSRTGLARSTVYKLIQSGDFPKPVKLTRRAVGWLQEDVEKFIAQRRNARDDTKSR